MTEFEKIIPEQERADIREMVSILLILPDSDKVLIKSNIRILKSLREIEKANQGMKGA